MSDAIDLILGQPQVRDILRRSLASSRLAQAYLFLGPAGSNKTQAAASLAGAILCPARQEAGGRMDCRGCRGCARVFRRTHPDVVFYEPEGANGYLVEQIREIVRDCALAPIQGECKIYILDRVDLLGSAAANAFLKTLEEPPSHVYFILLGRTRESVMPTIVSRCQILAFRHIPPSEAAGIVAQNTGSNIMQAKYGLEACSGSITKAIAFLNSSSQERLSFRAWLLSGLGRLRDANDWDIIEFARETLSRNEIPLAEISYGQEQDLKQKTDFFEASVIRRIEAQNRRRLSARSLEYLRQAFAISLSWLHDILVTCARCPDIIINLDVSDDINAAARATACSKVGGAMRNVERIMDMAQDNVSPENRLIAMLFEIRGIFYGKGCSS